MIPVHVLTGFLGSGKTTLLGSLLRHPETGRTAVIVNEFGEVGVDHDLLATGTEDFVQLSNGCLCCRVRSGLLDTLLALAARVQLSGQSGLERIVIETSGLADPVPIVQALMNDAEVRSRFSLAEVITTVDGVIGDSTLDRYVEAARQLAVADRIVLTKTDRADARIAAVERAVLAMRPEATLLRCARGQLAPSVLFHSGRGHAEPESRWQAHWPALGRANVPWAAKHTAGIASVAIVRDRPLHAATLPLFLSALAESLGANLIRMKGIVAIAEHPARPAVIHGVQHLYDVPHWLGGWPSSDTRTRIVCIGHRLHAEWIASLLDLLDAEVADEAERIAGR